LHGSALLERRKSARNKAQRVAGRASGHKTLFLKK